jgi:single-stranded-DNA-specific exonuclease
LSVEKTWHLLPHDEAAVGRLSRELGVAPVVAQLLLNRGLARDADARRFLDSPLAGLHPPQTLPGVTEAVELLFDAIRQRKKVCVYGDYDVDGTTGTAILKRVLQVAGVKADIYVPNRMEEGYGLNEAAMEQLAGEGVQVVVTVDCGIASVREARAAQRLGLTLIVSDHHEMTESLPDAAALVHPRLPGTSYPFGHLSGSAVAFKLAWALAVKVCGSEKVSVPFREALLDGVALASLGVVADVVPLLDENRIIVKHGLARLRQQPPVGLKALIEAAGLKIGDELRASDIGFKLGPRMNAAGRLGCARLVVDLLTTTDAGHAAQLARFLEEQNIKRQTLEREMVRTAREMVSAIPLDYTPALVLANPHWHAGVIGIVASRIAELYGRPTLMISLTKAGENDERIVGRGSGRSIPGFALNEALRACSDLLLSHGGHQQAAGFRILPDNIDAFRERFYDHARRFFPEGPPTPTLTLDAEVPLAALAVKLVKDLDRLEPYGSANRKPLFLASGLQVEGEPRKVGQGERHLSFRVRQGGTFLKAIAFGMSDRVEELMSRGGTCCLAFTPKINEWQGRQSVDLQIEDLKAGADVRL